MSRQVYFEGLYGRLTAVDEPEYVGAFSARATVSEESDLYKKGEVITSSASYFVYKAGFRNGFQWVREWRPARPLDGGCDDSST